jgi:hypothetical protein
MSPMPASAVPTRALAEHIGVASSPAAIRLRRPSWRDPRLAVGLLLLVAAALAGARLWASADDTVTVWATAAQVRAGEPVAGADLVASRVSLADGASASAYLSTSASPTGVFVRDLGAGELVPAAATGPAAAGSTVDVSVAVAPGHAPVDLAVGDVVDVWAVPEATAGRTAAPGVRVLTDARVTTAPSGAGLGASTREVVVTVSGPPRSTERRDALGPVLSAMARGQAVLVRVG